MSPTVVHPSRAQSARTYLELTRLLDDLERSHPEVSAPLRLTLMRAHREDRVGWLDEGRFRAVVGELRGAEQHPDVA